MVAALGWFYFPEGTIWRWGWREVEKIRIELHTLFPVPSLRSCFLDHCCHAKGFLLSLSPPSQPPFPLLPSLPPCFHSQLSLPPSFSLSPFLFTFAIGGIRLGVVMPVNQNSRALINFLLFSILFHSHKLSHGLFHVSI